MAGIYIHIPFCKQACNYCDFHFSTSLANRDLMIQCILKELELRKEYLADEKINTIYFGGGTPSILIYSELKEIVKRIKNSYEVDKDAEITIEANPDDLSFEKLTELKDIKINRLSIGVQSFNDSDLKWMNRAHNSAQVDDCLKNAQTIGFNNISIDLIYGLPNLSIAKWERNLQTAISFNIQHISAYCLTIEAKTALSRLVKLGNVIIPPERKIINQFILMQKVLSMNGFEQYEVSNFCKDSLESKHNSSYWLEKKYIGIGPSAHSFNGRSRQWNVSNNKVYIKNIAAGVIPFEIESIDNRTAYNEYVLTRLRTKWGIDKNYIVAKFQLNIDKHFKKELEEYIRQEDIIVEKKIIKLTKKGMLTADRIASDLFLC